MELTLTPTTQTVRASINEKRFFASMKHSFASSFSVLSEMMQNARRAGATFIAFTYDEMNATLHASDDGCGIDDFAVLMNLCESGWDDETMLKDSPYGMGFYSLFFACDEVTVTSNGRMLTMSIQDIETKRSLQTEPSGDSRKGTFITLKGLNKDLTGTHRLFDGNTTVEQPIILGEIAKFARAFPIEVLLNGKAMERPHAQAALKGEQTTLGFFSVAHLHDDRDVAALSKHKWDKQLVVAMYLQGLPIQVKPAGSAQVVIHLDGREFTPVLPDRNFLYNADEKIKLLHKTTAHIIRDFLSSKRQSLTDVEFAEQYWHTAICFGATKLLNDLPLFPVESLTYVGQLSYDMNYRHFSCETGRFIARNELLEHHKVWRQMPDDVYSEPGMGALLKYAQRNDVLQAETNMLDEGHWIFNSTPSCSDMVVRVEPIGKTTVDSMGVGAFSLAVQLVEALNITITSEVDPDFKLEEHIENDWVIDAAEDEDPEELVCFITRTDDSNDYPVCALSDFTDENDNYIEHWEDEAIANWKATIGGLLGNTLAQTIGSAIRDIGLPIYDTQVGNMVLTVGRAHWDSQDSEYRYNRLEVIDLDAMDVWERFALLASKVGDFTAESMRASFVQAAKAQGYVEGPKAESAGGKKTTV
jgi:hypothetical protein